MEWYQRGQDWHQVSPAPDSCFINRFQSNLLRPYCPYLVDAMKSGFLFLGLSYFLWFAEDLKVKQSLLLSMSVWCRISSLHWMEIMHNYRGNIELWRNNVVYCTNYVTVLIKLTLHKSCCLYNITVVNILSNWRLQPRLVRENLWSCHTRSNDVIGFCIWIDHKYDHWSSTWISANRKKNWTRLRRKINYKIGLNAVNYC